MLNTFGSFPPKYRLLLWRTLLKLPHNRLAFGGLRARGTHPAFQSLSRRFPGLAASQCARLGRVLSALAWWCPLLSQAPWVPGFVFPFVTLFAADDCGAFEAVAAVLLNILPGWLEEFPEPPMMLLALAEQAIAEEDTALSNHLDVSCGGAWKAIWHLLTTAFSDAFPAAEWAQLWDHLICGPPVLAPSLAAAILIASKNALMSVHTPDACTVLLTGRCGLNVDAVLNHAHKLAASRGEPLRSWNTPPVVLGYGAVYPPFGPVPDAQVKAAHDAVAAQQALVEQKARATALSTRVDGAASLQAMWDVEQRQLAQVRRQQQAEKQSLDAQMAAREAANQAAVLEARHAALDLREHALRQQLLRERAAWHEALTAGAADVDTRRAALDAQGALLAAEERIRNLEAEAEAREAAADVAAAHASSRQRVAAQAAASAAAQRLRGARFARATALADDASRVARAHGAARRAQLAAAREEAMQLAAAREAELQLQLAEEDAMAAALRERNRRDAAQTEAAITAAAIEAERMRSVTAADASAAALAAQAAADVDAYAAASRERASALAAIRRQAMDGALARDAAAASAAAQTRSAHIAQLLAERRSALAVADAEAEAQAQRALSLGAVERARDEALAQELRAQAKTLRPSPFVQAASWAGKSAVGATDDLSLRLERARRELDQAARDAAEAERTAASLRALAERDIQVVA